MQKALVTMVKTIIPHKANLIVQNTKLQTHKTSGMKITQLFEYSQTVPPGLQKVLSIICFSLDYQKVTIQNIVITGYLELMTYILKLILV